MSIWRIMISILADSARDNGILIVSVVLVALIGAAASVAVPYVFAYLINGLSEGLQSDHIFPIVLAYSLLFATSIGATQASHYLTYMLAEDISLRAGVQFFHSLLRKGPEFFLKFNPMEIGNARREGASVINMLVQLIIGGVIPGILKITLSGLMVISIVDWRLAVIVLLYGVSIIVLDYVRIGRVRSPLNNAIACSQQSAQVVGNAIAIVETIRQTRSSGWMELRFKTASMEAYRNWRMYASTSSRFSVLLGLATGVQFLVTFGILIPELQAGRIRLADIVLFNTLIIVLSEPFHVVGMAIKESVEAAARFAPLRAMWSAPDRLQVHSSTRLNSFVGTISLDNVGFRYPNGRMVGGISFTAQAGRLNFIVGESGSGKSTILKLLSKALSANEGQINLDGISIASISEDEWFRIVAVVPQDIVLLNETIKNNILLGRKFEEELLSDVLIKTYLSGLVEKLPLGIETQVGERGHMLSGGECQRIAIARALYGRPKVLLLDEASSSLDEDTEGKIMMFLRELSNYTTIIAVTHRRSVIIDEDNVIALVK